MNITLIILTILILKLFIVMAYCISAIKRLTKKVEEQSKSIESLNRVANYSVNSINDLTDIITSKSFGAFPLIGQKGDA
jgi:predicted Holliday junction resolvase-like endonuclease